jgi:O-antigen/teichoic acid export membrane protein
MIVVGLAGAAVLSFNLLSEPIDGGAFIFLVVLPGFTVLAIFAGYLKGTDRSWISPLFEIGGISFVASIALSVLLLLKLAISVQVVLIGFLGATGILLGTFWLIVKSDIKNTGAGDDAFLPLTQSENEANLKKGQYALMIGALAVFLMQAGFPLLVAPFLSESDLGLFRAAERMALLISFPTLVVNPLIAARLARQHQNKNFSQTTTLMSKAILTSVALATPFFVIMVWMPETVLNVLGPDFIAAAPYLTILAYTHLLLAFLAPFQIFLHMADAEKTAMKVNLTFLGISIVSYSLFSAYFSVLGACIAYALVVSGRSIAIALTALRHFRLAKDQT